MPGRPPRASVNKRTPQDIEGWEYMKTYRLLNGRLLKLTLTAAALSLLVLGRLRPPRA